MSVIFTDNRKREYLNADRIVFKTDDVKNEGVLLTSDKTQPALFFDDCCVINKNGSIILDFGREINGLIRFTIGVVIKDGVQVKNACLRVRFGESVSETMSELEIKNAGNDHTPRDINLTVSQYGSCEYGETGFRFVKIDVLDADIVYFQSICAVSVHSSDEIKGSFECDDALLNKIWQTGAYTLSLCMQNYLIEGVKRDRLVWIGDMHPEISTLKCVYGYSDLVEKSIDYVSKNSICEGWINGIASYSMWWLIIQYDWYMQNGNIEYLKKNEKFTVETVKKAISWISNYYEHNRSFVNFVDWSSHDTSTEDGGVFAMFVLGLQSAVKILEVYGNYDELINKCKDTVEKIKNNDIYYKDNKQISALVGLSKIENPNKVVEEVIKKDLLKGISTFMGYYIIKLLGEIGDSETAFDIIKGYWGKMLEFGATTFWEDFDISWTGNSFGIDELPVKGKNDIHGDFGKFCYKQFRHSLCHGWATGPTAYLSEYVLGVKILKPGCKEVLIKPNLGNLKWVNGSYPTPYGVIKIKHYYDENNKLITEFEAPKEVKIILG